MPWTDRLLTMEYRSPSGDRFVLQFDDLARTGGKKAPVTEFPGQDQAGVQELGELTPRFPITCYITGVDYDQEADRFWAALEEEGAGRLAHPRWGTIEVLPLQKEQREQFVDGAGRAVFSIEFIKVSDRSFEFPRVSTSVDDRIVSSADDAQEAITASLDGVDTTDVLQQSAVSEFAADAATTVVSEFDAILDEADDIRAEIEETAAEINRNIDALVEDPQELISTFVGLVRAPAIAGKSVIQKVRGYSGLGTALGAQLASVGSEYADFGLQVSLGIWRAIMFAAGLATTEGGIATRADAQRVADALTDLQSTATTAIESLETEPDYTAQAAANLVVTRALDNLIDRSLSLPTERVLTLDRAVTPLTLTWELYGGIDRLDELISYNNLRGDELLMIPRGREVRWYA
ncbi:MAG: DNA circularization N-terminal domain-containing protein [Spirochaetota bacterium]